jgi:hypothetical protein
MPPICLKLIIMRKNNLHSFSLEPAYILDRQLGLLPICMDTARASLDVQPLADGPLLAHDTPIVARVARKVDLRRGTRPGKQVDMAGEMARGIDDKHTTVAEDVDDRGEAATGCPGLLKIGLANVGCRFWFPASFIYLAPVWEF